MHLKDWLLKIIKTAFSDTRQTIVSIIVVALIGGYSGLLYLSKTALGYFLQFMRSQTPVWATIALTVVCCIYIYLKTANIKTMLHKKGPSFDASSSSQPQSSNRERPLSEIHCKVLALLFKSPSTIEYICKTLKIDKEEANYYLNDLYDKDMVALPTAYASGPETWHIAQDGREYIMNQRKTA